MSGKLSKWFDTTGIYSIVLRVPYGKINMGRESHGAADYRAHLSAPTHKTPVMTCNHTHFIGLFPMPSLLSVIVFIDFF